ncbi:MAG: hypothetical protein ABWY27_14510, partial [Telluria sp.]
VRYEEAYWHVPESGQHANFRNYPAFSPVARSDVAMAMPQQGDLPALATQLSIMRLAPARPVLGVHGILRDAALAKLLALRDIAPSSSSPRALTKAESFMLETTLARLRDSGLGEDALQMAATLIGNQFVAADASGAARDTRHPIIGLRGAVHLAWENTAPSPAHVPTVLYRIYAARGAPAAAAHARVRCTGAGAFEVVSERQPYLLRQPALMMIDRRMQWTGLAVRQGAALAVQGLRGGPTAVGQPQPGTEYDCWFFEGQVAAEVKPVLPAGKDKFEAGLPVAGGHSETGVWWLAAVNCVNEEAWRRDDGSAVMLTLDLPETITPAAPVRLQARAPIDFGVEALQKADHRRYHAMKVIPDLLMEDGGRIYPRTILTWDAAEFSAAETYLLFERQQEANDAALAMFNEQDPSWGLLKTIETGPTGAPWDEAYRVLQPWLEGKSSPQPPAGQEPARRAFFFPTEDPGDHAAWNMKDVDMLPATGAPWPDARSYADYFASPPSDGDRASLTRGERRVRYRAYKMVDLQPLLPGPDPAAFHTRYLVSEPSAWTGWAQADWPPLKFAATSTSVARAGSPLISFKVSCDFATPALARTALGNGRDGALLFRLEIYRQLDTAFGETQTTMRIGELLEIPVPDGTRPPPMLTADFSVERDDPGAATTARYGFTAALVARRPVDGIAVDTVLRMADVPAAYQAMVPASLGTAETALLVDLRIQIG